MKRWFSSFFAPQPLIRLEFIRIFAPLAILGFLACRLIHPEDWLSARGFQVPRLEGKDWRQPLYFAPLPVWGAWIVSAGTVVSGLMVSLGFKTRWSAGIFAVTLAYLAMADRLAAFTVSKLGPVLILALWLAPAGQAFSFDAWRRGASAPARIGWGPVRFFQALLIVLYTTSGIAKAREDWLRVPNVLWTHMHDSYQTVVTYWVARSLPAAAWPVLQGVVLALEVGAFIWFVLPWTRKPALMAGLGMHAFIGFCFGPVKWFALLMAILLIGAFAPEPVLERFAGVTRKLRSLGNKEDT